MTRKNTDKIANPFEEEAKKYLSKETIEAVDGKNTAQNNARETNSPEPKNIDYKQSKVVYIEKKTERLQLLLQPSIKTALQKEAKKKHTSVNELINEILREYFNS